MTRTMHVLATPLNLHERAPHNLLGLIARQVKMAMLVMIQQQRFQPEASVAAVLPGGPSSSSVQVAWKGSPNILAG